MTRGDLGTHLCFFYILYGRGASLAEHSRLFPRAHLRVLQVRTKLQNTRRRLEELMHSHVKGPVYGHANQLPFYEESKVSPGRAGIGGEMSDGIMKGWRAFPLAGRHVPGCGARLESECVPLSHAALFHRTSSSRSCCATIRSTSAGLATWPRGGCRTSSGEGPHWAA